MTNLEGRVSRLERDIAESLVKAGEMSDLEREADHWRRWCEAQERDGIDQAQILRGVIEGWHITREEIEAAMPELPPTTRVAVRQAMQTSESR